MRAGMREWRPSRPVDVSATLGVHGRGRGDPTFLAAPDGSTWRTARTPDGPGTLRVAVRRADGVVAAAAWGPGADWLLEMLPAWLGDGDDDTGFDPVHPVLRRTYDRLPGWRVGRTGLVMEALVPAVLEQKVTGTEARRGWRSLLLRFGEPAPGPAPRELRVVPRGEDWARIPSWEWHLAGVGPQRARTVVQATAVAGRLEEAAAMTGEQAERRLRTVPGIGVWTAAEVRQRALGDPDAVSVGDYHLPRLVGWVLAGEDGADDARMLELLEPYRGHRYRACRLVERSALRPARRGPRAPVRDYRRI
jgi:3-methyladenine DNA glycosylase/8-oxoguanine DNA glycosylase